MERRLVVTVAIGDGLDELASLTTPGQDGFARRAGADYLVLRTPAIRASSSYYETFQLYALFERYDRILYLDLDALVRDDCPDLFAVVPRECLGVFVESRLIDRSRAIQRAQAVWSPIEWRGDYFNNGVLLATRESHRELFNPQRDDFRPVPFFDQTLMNYRAARARVDLYDIGPAFNYMPAILGRGRLVRVLLNDIYRGIPRIPGLCQAVPTPEHAFIVHLGAYSLRAKVRLARHVRSQWAAGGRSSFSPDHRRLNRVFWGLVPRVVNGAAAPEDTLEAAIWSLCNGTRTAAELLQLVGGRFPDRRLEALWPAVRHGLNRMLASGALEALNQAG